MAQPAPVVRTPPLLPVKDRRVDCRTHDKPLFARRSEPYVAKETTMHELNSCRGRRVACEWSERDERQRRQSCEGSSERVRARSEFQKSVVASLCDARLGNL